VSAPLLVVEHLRKVFAERRGEPIVAVDDVSFALAPGGSLAVVGESGSGKSTTARAIVGLERPTAGRIALAGHDRSLPARTGGDRLRRGREAQMIFQDPYSSLDPRQRVGEAIGEVLDLYFKPPRDERAERIAQRLDQVGLSPDHAHVLPAALSGGQRQRVAIARALAAEPRLVILDEAVAALDVSIQAQVLNLLADLREQTGVAYLFVSHDLAVVRQVTDDAIVMRRGRIVEAGRTADILESPRDPYTRLLLDSVPRPGWVPRRRAAA
jgi:ABC-type glutathione transport system ATPase component